MDLETLQNYCLAKKGSTSALPFDNNVLVFKVMGKMFCLTGLDTWEKDAPTVNLKCDPDRALLLRSDYEAVRPGYHMNKKHWNTIEVNEDVPDALLEELINHSYDLIVKSLPKKLKGELDTFEG